MSNMANHGVACMSFSFRNLVYSEMALISRPEHNILDFSMGWTQYIDLVR